jgi:hypothetical protein
VKRAQLIVVAVVAVIAVGLAFAVGLLIGTSDGTDDAAAPVTTASPSTVPATPEPTSPPATSESPGDEPSSTDAPSTSVAAEADPPATEATEDLSVEPDAAESSSESDGGPLAGNFGEAADIVPPGEPFIAEFATASDFFDRFDWDWGMRPDPRTFDIAAEGLTAQADHSGHGNADESCGPPTETRTIHLREPDEQVYWCGPKGPESGHIMTATPFTGYGILTFSPRQSFTDITKVCWDQNLTFLDGRRWTNIVVLPEEEYQEHAPRLDYAAPGFGPGNDVGGLNLDTPETARTIKVFMGSMFWYPSHDGPEEGSNGAGIFENDDRATRYTHCVEDLGNGTVRATQERPEGGEAVSEWPGDLPDGEVRVLFQDDRYDTEFDDTPITWHWDNIHVS